MYNKNGGSDKHCDVILINDDSIFFIELKNTESTIEQSAVESIINTMPGKFAGTFKTYINKIQPLLERNLSKNKKFKYVFYIHKNTFDILKQLKAIITKQKNKLLYSLAKEAETVIIKPCGEDLYISQNCIQLKK